MSSKQDILSRYRSSVKERFDMPSLEGIDPIVWDDPVEQFKKALEQAGGKAVDVPEGADINALLKELFPSAGSFASNLPEISITTVSPDSVAMVQDLDGLDVGIVQGRIGVAENACVWVPQTMKEKAVCFICEHLVILLDRASIVNNMHEAYRKISLMGDEAFGTYGFGTFISGPSKTADIAQVLVMGAQAARSVTVLLK